MVTIPLTQPLFKIEVPTREELKAMLTRTPIMITGIICATIIFLGALGSVVYLAVTGHDSSVIGVLIVGVLAAVAKMLSGRISGLQRTVDEMKQGQTRDS